MNRVGQALLEARLKAKMSPKELAKKCGLTESFILQVESGKKIAQEAIIEKMMKAVGAGFDQLDPSALIEKEKVVAVKPVLKPQIVHEKPSETVALTGQWKDALAGVIRAYPIMRGNKQQGEMEMVIANKKIEGVHPDMVAVVLSQDTVESLRVHDGDILILSTDTQLINDKLYYIQYYGKYLLRRLRKEQNGMLTVSPGLSGGAAEQVKDGQIKLVGRVIRVQFVPK